MNHWRANPFGDPVVVAEGRRARPHDRTAAETAAATTAAAAVVSHDPMCAFCTGNEDLTPPEIAADRPDGSAPDTPGWQTRVVPNKYAAFQADAAAAPWTGDGLHLQRAAVGLHEVAIHSPDHAGRLSRLDDAALAPMLATWQARLVAHRSAGWTSTVLAVNEGPAAGASLPHPHAQLFATDTVPPAWLAELDRQRDWIDDHANALLHDVVTAERRAERSVDAEDGLVAWCPYWASVPYEVWIAAAERDSPGGAFADSPDLGRLVRLLGRTMRRLAAVTGGADVNLVLRDVPHGGHRASWWHVRIVPRTSTAAGWELASGVRIVTVAPETAAAELRAASPDVTGLPPAP